MFHSKDKQIDGFIQDFDSLVDALQSVAKDTVGQLSIVEPCRGPFSLDLSLQHTDDHADCPACRAINESLQVNSADMARMHFPEATRLWMLMRRQSDSFSERTHQSNQGYLDALEKFFGAMRLCDITPGHLRSYQIAREHNSLRGMEGEVHPWKRKSGHSIVNHELCALGLIMKHCRLWHRIKPYYFPRPTPKWTLREIFTIEEEEQFFQSAGEHPEAQLAYWVAAITGNTSASGCELRGLRLKHVFLRDPGEISEIYIPEDSVKNNSRPRMIALNVTARWAVSQCYKRAIKLGACDPEDFLFPWRAKRNCYNPKHRPSASVFRNSWKKLRIATGFPKLKPHDLRFLCITRLLENGADPETVIAIAGHVDRKMLEYYARQRKQVKYAAVMAIESKKKPPTSENTEDMRKKLFGQSR